MHYEINVSKHGYHFFATHERSITDETKLKLVYQIFKDRFPASEGYELKVSRIQTTGTYIKMD